MGGKNLLDKFWKFFKKDRQEEIDEKYVFVSESEINEELKRNIVELERLGDEWSKVLQRKYANIFESQGKQNLRIWDFASQFYLENVLPSSYGERTFYISFLPT